MSGRCLTTHRGVWLSIGPMSPCSVHYMNEEITTGATHRAWHARGYHPHLDVAGAFQTISFRLSDSVPKALLDTWRMQSALGGPHASRKGKARLRRLIAEYEDRGFGACHLRDPRVAELVQQALHFHNGKSYELLEWCVMNHVHVLIQQRAGAPLGRVVNSWKTYTARRANAVLGRQGRFWMRDYFDRYIRSAEHFDIARYYIRHNPVKAGLCEKAEDWPWSSANPAAWPHGAPNGSK